MQALLSAIDTAAAMEMAICVASGAVVGGAMVASQEASRRRRQAFMRKGDQVLHRLLGNPQELAQLKRVARMPDEALVWFIIAHVRTARLSQKRFCGKQLRLRVKHGAQGWSVERVTPEAEALPPAVVAVDPRAVPEASSTPTTQRESTEQDVALADFDTTLLFVWSIGLQPLLRLRLQKQRSRRGGVWSTVGWAEIPLSEAGRASFEEVDACLYDSKFASRQIRPGDVIGSVSVLLETRGVFLGDLRTSGLNVGTVVPAPLPGQGSMNLLQGEVVENTGLVAQGVAVTPVRGVVPVRGRNFVRPRAAESISESSEEEHAGSSEASHSEESSCSEGEGGCSSALANILLCKCR